MKNRLKREKCLHLRSTVTVSLTVMLIIAVAGLTGCNTATNKEAASPTPKVSATSVPSEKPTQSTKSIASAMPMDTSNSKADTQTSYYGQWAVQKVLAYGSAGTYSKDNAEKLVGKSLEFSKEKASLFTDQPSDTAVIIENPNYQEAEVSKDEFLTGFNISFDKLGITAESVTEVQVTGADGIGGTVLIKDSNTIILIAGGTYFELVKK